MYYSVISQNSSNLSVTRKKKNNVGELKITEDSESRGATILFFNSLKKRKRLDVVAHACNPSTLGG